MQRAGEHAVVLGASMAGLATARVLSEFYDRVTVVERDVLPEGPEFRRGVPQARHAHGLLARGREILEELFPGFTAEAVAAGGLSDDIGQRIRWCGAGGNFAKGPSGLTGLATTRTLLETLVRKRVRGLPGVIIRDGVAVAGLLASDDGRRVTGVRLGEGEHGEDLLADFVVDATGRGSRSPAWLEAMGYARPEEEEVRVGIVYGSRLYRRREDQLGGDAGAVVNAGPSGRGGVLIAQEGDRWIVTLFGYGGDAPPTDDAGYLEFAASLHGQDIYDVLRDSEPLTAPLITRYPASKRRRYERLRRFPEGYLVFGDAVCSFNPAYGQGMTVALSEAMVLRDCLEKGGEDVARRFFRAAAKFVDIPWSIAVGADLRFPSVEGRRTAGVRFINWYLDRLHIAACRDAELAATFLRVANLTAPKTTILAPRTVWRVLRGNLGGGRERSAAPVFARTETT